MGFALALADALSCVSCLPKALLRRNAPAVGFAVMPQSCPCPAEWRRLRRRAQQRGQAAAGAVQPQLPASHTAQPPGLRACPWKACTACLASNTAASLVPGHATGLPPVDAQLPAGHLQRHQDTRWGCLCLGDRAQSHWPHASTVCLQHNLHTEFFPSGAQASMGLCGQSHIAASFRVFAFREMVRFCCGRQRPAPRQAAAHASCATSSPAAAATDPFTTRCIMCAEDLPEEMFYNPQEGLHLHVWTGTQHAFNIAASLSSHGTLAGCLTGVREQLAPVQSREDYAHLLDTYLPQLPHSLRGPIAASAAVRRWRRAVR